MRRLPVIVAMLMAVSGVAAAPAAAADENGTYLQCTGTLDNTYDPGLTFEDQDVTTTTSYHYGYTVPCRTDATKITRGSRTATGTTINNCADLLLPVTGTSSINWHNSQDEEIDSTSTFTFTSYGTQSGLTTTWVLEGTITSGRFTGQPIRRVTTVLATDVTGSCASPDGLTETHGSTVLTIGTPEL